MFVEIFQRYGHSGRFSAFCPLPHQNFAHTLYSNNNVFWDAIFTGRAHQHFKQDFQVWVKMNKL
jgi:hypothetical protein